MIRSVIATSGVCLIVAGLATVVAYTTHYRKLQRSLERSWRIERLVYRHHRGVGSAIVVAALVLLVVLGIKHTRLFGAGLPEGFGMRAAEFLVWLSALAVLLIGFMVRVRPSALKNVEALANRSIQLSPTIIRTRWPIGVLLLIAGIICIAVAI